MNKRKNKRLKHDGKMDKECIALCDALNTFPGIRTIVSCCGHGERPFRIWFMARFLAALPPLVGCLRGYEDWRCTVETDDTASITRFLIEGPVGRKAIREAKDMAKRMRMWARAAEILDLRTAMQRLPDKLERKRGMYYLATKTLPTAIPTGYVLVHNHIRHRVNTPSGIRGFRAWFQKPSDRLEQCDCGWSGLPHYRVKLK